VLAAMTDWGMGLLGRPRKGEEVRGAWVVLSIAVTTPVPDVDDATYEFRVDGDVLQVDVRDGRLQPRHGGASDPTAVVTADATTLVDLAFSRLELDDALARGRITVAGDEAKGRRLLESMTRARTGAAST
jgi:SCP-2 sterol transfer family